jgi:putative molybdopterin biosynthesis protein
VKQDQFLHVLDRDEAERRFQAALAPLEPVGVDVVPVGEALGRVLAEDVVSPVSVPGFDRSNVDGWAVRATDTFGAAEHAPKRLRVSRDSVAMGRVPSAPVEPGTAMAIPTGGVVPRGADAIVMVEHSRVEAGAVVIVKAVTPGRWITYAGTDVAQGEVVLRAREPCTSRETGLLAAMGIPSVRVFRKPVVAVFSTGDEIVRPGAPIAAGQIFDSNAVMLCDAVRELGGEPLPLGIVPDDAGAIRSMLQQALDRADLVVLSGGTSKGPGDLNVRVLEEVLAPPGILVHGVALKPGKPICLAASRRKGVVVLPGFPTSAIFTFHEFVAPVVRALAGTSAHGGTRTCARLPFRTSSEIGRTEYVLVRLASDPRGEAVAYPIGKGSGSVTTWSQADGYFVVPARVEQLDEGEVVSLGGTRPAPVDLVVIGSHCVGLDVLLGRLRLAGVTSKAIAVGSEGGLAAVKRGECDLAGIHLFDPATGTYNIPFLEPGLELVPGYARMQGVLFRPGDTRFHGKPAGEAVRAAAASPGVVMVNRNRGSGTRVLIDRLLGGARPQGYAVEATSHHAVAAAVAQGRADFGVAIDVVARDRSLGFLPVAEERFDFVVADARRDRPAVRAFVAELARPEMRAALRERGLLA